MQIKQSLLPNAALASQGHPEADVSDDLGAHRVLFDFLPRIKRPALFSKKNTPSLKSLKSSKHSRNITSHLSGCLCNTWAPWCSIRRVSLKLQPLAFFQKVYKGYEIKKACLFLHTEHAELLLFSSDESSGLLYPPSRQKQSIHWFGSQVPDTLTPLLPLPGKRKVAHQASLTLQDLAALVSLGEPPSSLKPLQIACLHEIYPLTLEAAAAALFHSPSLLEGKPTKVWWNLLLGIKARCREI